MYEMFKTIILDVLGIRPTPIVRTSREWTAWQAHEQQAHEDWEKDRRRREIEERRQDEWWWRPDRSMTDDEATKRPPATDFPHHWTDPL